MFNLISSNFNFTVQVLFLKAIYKKIYFKSNCIVWNSVGFETRNIIVSNKGLRDDSTNGVIGSYFYFYYYFFFFL